jgi:hypothetical protein
LIALGSDKGLEFVTNLTLRTGINPEMTSPVNFDDADLITPEFLDRSEMSAVSAC